MKEQLTMICCCVGVAMRRKIEKVTLELSVVDA